MGDVMQALEDIESEVAKKAREEDRLTRDNYHQLVAETIEDYNTKELDEVEVKAIIALLKLNGTRLQVLLQSHNDAL